MTRSQPRNARACGSVVICRWAMPCKDHKLTIVQKEAELVRSIYRTYLRLGSIDRLSAELRRRRVRTKRRTYKSGRTIGGMPFTRGPLSYLLRNRFYIGEVVFKGEVLPGPQPALLSRDLFDAVQAKLAEQLNNHTQKRAKSDALLLGKIFDDRGTLMGPSHTPQEGTQVSILHLFVPAAGPQRACRIHPSDPRSRS